MPVMSIEIVSNMAAALQARIKCMKLDSESDHIHQGLLVIRLFSEPIHMNMQEKTVPAIIYNALVNQYC